MKEVVNLRDYFAREALIALVSHSLDEYNCHHIGQKIEYPERLSREAYKVADAMIEERKK